MRVYVCVSVNVCVFVYVYMHAGACKGQKMTCDPPEIASGWY